MANAYGRGATSYAQKGTQTGPSQTFEAKNVEDLLKPNELAKYNAALENLSEGTHLKKKSGKIKHLGKVLKVKNAALDEVNRLRDLAAGRAFRQFSSMAMKSSKPWLVKPSEEGILASQDVAHAYAKSRYFGGEGVPYGPRTWRKQALRGTVELGSVDLEQAREAWRKKARSIFGSSLDYGY